jgi:hypothetical protein
MVCINVWIAGVGGVVNHGSSRQLEKKKEKRISRKQIGGMTVLLLMEYYEGRIVVV